MRIVTSLIESNAAAGRQVPRGGAQSEITTMKRGLSDIRYGFATGPDVVSDMRRDVRMIDQDAKMWPLRYFVCALK